MLIELQALASLQSLLVAFLNYSGISNPTWFYCSQKGFQKITQQLSLERGYHVLFINALQAGKCDLKKNTKGPIGVGTQIPPTQRLTDKRFVSACQSAKLRV